MVLMGVFAPLTFLPVGMVLVWLIGQRPKGLSMFRLLLVTMFPFVLLFLPIVNLLGVGVCGRLLSFPNLRVSRLINGVVLSLKSLVGTVNCLSFSSCLIARPLMFSVSGICFN